MLIFNNHIIVILEDALMHQLQFTEGTLCMYRIVWMSNAMHHEITCTLAESEYFACLNIGGNPYFNYAFGITTLSPNLFLSANPDPTFSKTFPHLKSSLQTTFQTLLALKNMFPHAFHMFISCSCIILPVRFPLYVCIFPAWDKLPTNYVAGWTASTIPL